MKKTKKTLLTAAALAAAFNMAACTAPDGEESSVPDGSSYDPSLSEEYGVYGPPREEIDAESAQTSSASEDTSSKSDSSKAEASSADETPEYDPSEDDVYDVYGPPADYEDTDISIPDDDDGEYTTTMYVPEYDPEYDPEYYPEYDPEYEEIQVVYGPPPGIED